MFTLEQNDSVGVHQNEQLDQAAFFIAWHNETIASTLKHFTGTLKLFEARVVHKSFRMGFKIR